MHIIGTAGHVDHGKSTLVHALTGTHPDRWAEERERGMTLDLGFALLAFDDGIEAGIVDVPGHERFLHNMLAGAAGMELLLLVVDAVEGVMPQTREHLQILRYLNVREVLVVATKSDLLPPGALDGACHALHESLAGTIAADAPVVAVSAVTGENMDALRSAIHDALARLEPRPHDAPAYLPIDRAFALAGHGTIVTGTLMQGTLLVGDTLKLQPSDRSVRVRSLQSFHTSKERVAAGARVAVNIAAVGANDVARGEVLAHAQFRANDTFDVTFWPVTEALPILRRRNAVRAYIGSAEILGTLVLPYVPVEGEEVSAQLHLRTPAIAPPNSAFVVRRLSPKNLLGGGRIAAPAAAAAVRQTGVVDAAAAAVAATLAASPRIVSTPAEIARETNVREERVEEILAEMAERGDAVAVARPLAYADAAAAQTLLARVTTQMRAHQESEPWVLGLTSLALARALGADEGPLLRLLTAFAQDGAIALRAGYFASADHVPALNAEQRAFFDEAAQADPANPFAPVPLQRVVAAVKQSRVPGIGKAFDTLIAKGELVKVNDDLYRGPQLAAIRARLEAFLRANGEMTMAQFRDLIGTSRKYAVPLLEWFDARGITVRSGDVRMLRRHA